MRTATLLKTAARQILVYMIIESKVWLGFSLVLIGTVIPIALLTAIIIWITNLKFTKEKPKFSFVFQAQLTDVAYSTRLRNEYKLDDVVAGKNGEYEKVRAISLWVHSRWKHAGFNEPKKSDAISILEEVAEGKRFRRVEYAIVLSAALHSIGIPARVLGLRTEDAETRQWSAGHVVAEAYLSGSKKWIMVDGQWDAIPTLKGKPLNAVEFQKAIADANSELAVDSSSDVEIKNTSNGLRLIFTTLQQKLNYNRTRQNARLFSNPSGRRI